MAIDLTVNQIGIMLLGSYIFGGVPWVVYLIFLRKDFIALRKNKQTLENLYRSQTEINLQINERLMSQITKLIEGIDSIRLDMQQSVSNVEAVINQNHSILSKRIEDIENRNGHPG